MMLSICRELVEISPSFYLNIKLNHPYPTIFKFNLKIINDDFFNTYTVVCKFESQEENDKDRERERVQPIY